MEIFALYVSWANFLDVRRVQAEIDEASAETDAKVLEAVRMAGWDDKQKVTFARAEMNIDPEVLAARSMYEQNRARRKMLTVLCTNMERGSALLSRELSRRLGRSPVEGRAASWGT